MPIVDIELVTGPAESPAEGLAASLADGLGEVFGSAPGRTWVRLRTLPASNYAENHSQAPRPVFVSLTLGRPPEGEALRTLVRGVAEAVAKACGRSAEHVHVLLEPPAQGRIAFGGDLN